jgi:hypothetical protein
VGGGPSGFGITGLTLRSDDSGGRVRPWTGEPPPPGWLLLVELLLPPQPAATIAAAAISAVDLPHRIGSAP